MANEPWKMPDQPDKPTAERAEAQALRKKHSAFFAAVRARGVLNHMLDGPVKQFEEVNPGMRARWEYCPTNLPRSVEQGTNEYGNMTFVVAREGLGFHVVDASELKPSEDSAQKKGPIQVGDLILMAAPAEIVLAIEEEDARAAMADFKLPVSSYREYIKGIRAQRADGSVMGAEPVGDVRLTQEVLSASPRAGLDHELASE